MIKINGLSVSFGSFPNGESYLSLDELKTRALNRVEWLYEGDDEFFKLALLKDHIDSLMVKAEIAIHYMPHSRMDRINGDYAMSIRTATSLVNNMGFVSVTVSEPHSDVTPALLRTVFQNNWCMGKLAEVVQRCGADTLFFPDAGACKRYSSKLPYAVGHKSRDFKTGAITSFELLGDVGDRVLIVDDLCSKGGTFVFSADLLGKHGAKEVFLLVAHCEKTVYSGDIFEHISKIYTSKNNQGIKRSDCIELI